MDSLGSPRGWEGWLMSWADNPNGIYDPPEILPQIPLRGPSMCSFEQLVSLTLSSEAGEGLVSESFHMYCSMIVFFPVETFLSPQCFALKLAYDSCLLLLPHSCPYRCWNKWTRRHASGHVKWLLLCPVQILAETAAGTWPVVLHKDVQIPTILLL